MNVDVRILFGDGERAAKDGQLATARACFVEAAQAAIDVQLWRSALRCYRHALELDLFDREVLAAISKLPARIISGRGWDSYRATIEARSAHRHFGCRCPRVVIGDSGSVVECTPAGAVMELMMTEPDLVECRPVAAMAWMPTAMALVILRRAMWPIPDEREEPASLRVLFAGAERVWLDELGDWDPLVGA